MYIHTDWDKTNEQEKLRNINEADKNVLSKQLSNENTR